MNYNFEKTIDDYTESERLYLQVPYACKENAKINGCQWDNKLKKWYVNLHTTPQSNIQQLLQRYPICLQKLTVRQCKRCGQYFQCQSKRDWTECLNCLFN